MTGLKHRRVSLGKRRPSSDSLSLRSPFGGSSSGSISMISPRTGDRWANIPDDEEDLVSVIAFAAGTPEGVEKEELSRGMQRFTFPRRLMNQVEDDLNSQGVRWSEE